MRRTVPVARFVDAIRAELIARRIDGAHGPILSLYLGGGTPSKLGAGVADVTNLISTLSNSPSIGELTVEANPEDIRPEVVRAWRAAGVNRVSLGVQSFDDEALRWMHRTHAASDAITAVHVLRAEGIGNISLDLIFALPDSLARDWTRDLGQAIALEPDHLSVYGLTVEPHTPLGHWTDRGRVAGASDERYEAEFLEADRELAAAGYGHYEVSSYAKPGAESVHNSAYWSGASYLGVGPAAHGYDGETRRWNIREYTKWLSVVESGLDPMAGDETLWPSERAAERVYLGLRTAGGLQATDDELACAEPWLREGWAEDRSGRLVLTPRGWLRMDSLATILTNR